MINTIPLTLYIHFPWCLRKCPYCDFYSREIKKPLNESETITLLTTELKQKIPLAQNRALKSIFIGGGTPSLLSANAIDKILNLIHQNMALEENIEITLEVNPGTTSQAKLTDYYSAGINRLSIGVQTFQENALKKLGRIHNGDQSKQTLIDAQRAGFSNINCDIMHGLPNQTVNDALSDLTTAIQFSPQHLSWYELTIESDTPFGKSPPLLPKEKTLIKIQCEGHALLHNHGYHQYEISAYSQPDFECRHNLNYWQFGDYLSLGQGAHGKVTDLSTKPLTINRYEENNRVVLPHEIPLEFMLNSLRLTRGFPEKQFEERTGINLKQIEPPLSEAIKQGFLERSNHWIKTTALGKQFLNQCLALFIQ